MFAKCILPAVKSRPDITQARAVRDRLARWRAGEYAALWREAVDMTRKRGKQRRKTQQQEQQSLKVKNAQRSKRLAQEGEYTRAVQALTSAGLADHTPATIRAMRDKHPTAQPSTFQSSDTSPQLAFTAKQVQRAIKSFRKGSAPGPDGLRAEHLKVAIKSTPSRQDKAEEAITRLVNKMADGSVPDSVAPFLSGARLHAGKKKGGTDIRPIAVGNIISRLTAECFSYALTDKAANIFCPHQMGVAVRGGMEALVQTVRQVVEGEEDDLMLLQLDFLNAFNHIDRTAAFKEVEEHFPEMMKWVLTCYGHQAVLMFGNTVILSQAGFHQGDPLASLLLSLVLHSVVRIINQRLPNLRVNGWYLDDGGLLGRLAELREAVDIVLEYGPPRGLLLSTKASSSNPKSTIWCPSATRASQLGEDPLDMGIPLVREPGIVLLGSPIGSVQYERSALQTIVDKVKEILDRLPLMEDPHSEYVLLRSCLSILKVMFTLRTTNPTNHADVWLEFDRNIRDALCRILGAALSHTQWKQATLPVSSGSLGLRTASDHCSAAYISSILSSQELKMQILDQTADDSPPDISQSLLDSLAEKTGAEQNIACLQG